MKTKSLTALSVFGLFAAAATWALHQQIDYVFSSTACTLGLPMMWAVTVLALLTLGAAAVATFGIVRSGAVVGVGDEQRPRRFLISISLLALPLFLFAIFLQASALLFLPSCA